MMQAGTSIYLQIYVEKSWPHWLIEKDTQKDLENSPGKSWHM